MLKNILLFFISLSCFASPEDSLLLIRKSRVKFCMEQITLVSTLSSRILVKDSLLEVTNKRIENKDSTIESFERTTEKYQVHVNSLKTEVALKDSDLNIYKKETKKLTIQNKILKFGIGGLGLLSIYLSVKD